MGKILNDHLKALEVKQWDMPRTAYYLSLQVDTIDKDVWYLEHAIDGLVIAYKVVNLDGNMDDAVADLVDKLDGLKKRLKKEKADIQKWMEAHVPMIIHPDGRPVKDGKIVTQVADTKIRDNPCAITVYPERVEWADEPERKGKDGETE
jgi:hypothetical protein